MTSEELIKDGVRVEFQTETSLDTRAFMTFGLNAKPNSNNPIGEFGTGLKMAIAVLVRNEIPITIYTDLTSYEFYAKTSDFRGQKVVDIKYKKRKYDKVKGKWKVVSHGRLPYTTNLAKGWKLWAAFREIQSNTMDEQGVTSCREGNASSVDDLVKSGRTIVVVGGNAFAQVYHNRNEIFLPNATRYDNSVDSDGNVVHAPDMEVFDAPSRYIYYRGIRVLDLNAHNYSADAEINPIKSRYTYNLIGDTTLTEDRTLAYAYGTLSRIGRWIMKHTDEAWIRDVLETDEQKFWEGKIDFANPSITPSAEFMRAYRSAANVLLSAKSFMRAYDTLPPPKRRERLPPSEIVKRLGMIRKNYDLEHWEQQTIDDAIAFIKQHETISEDPF